MRKTASSDIHEFFFGLDPNTAPKNIKLMYYYYVGSNNLFQEMTTEAVQEFKLDAFMTKFAKSKSNHIYRSPQEQLQDKIKKEYGRGKHK